MTAIPAEPPFALRARILSPLADGGLLDEPDGMLEVDAVGAHHPGVALGATPMRPP